MKKTYEKPVIIAKQHKPACSSQCGWWNSCGKDVQGRN